MPVALQQAKLKRDCDRDGRGKPDDPMFSMVQVMAELLSEVRFLLFLCFI